MDAREPKLPKWAQDQIRGYRAEIETLRRRLAEMVGDVGPTNVVVQNYSEGDQPLPMGATVVFRLSDAYDDYVQARVERGRLLLHGGRSLGILPNVSNSISLRTVGR